MKLSNQKTNKSVLIPFRWFLLVLFSICRKKYFSHRILKLSVFVWRQTQTNCKQIKMGKTEMYIPAKELWKSEDITVSGPVDRHHIGRNDRAHNWRIWPIETRRRSNQKLFGYNFSGAIYFKDKYWIAQHVFLRERLIYLQNVIITHRNPWHTHQHQQTQRSR